MSDSAPELPPGKPNLIAGRYQVGALLGSGGMADVYRATDTRLHRQVAVKVLRSGTVGESEDVVRARFAAEGLMAAKLNHPRVVSIFDAGEQNGRAFLVMECMPGNTLRDEMSKQRLTEAQIRCAVTDVLDALEAAHQAGLVHRDVKPANILATTDGRWKVADFGIAQAERLMPGAEDLTSTGLLVGTPRYVAPERYAGHRATVASDLYSVGVMLDELLEASGGGSPALSAVATRARAVDPTQRFASAASMAAAIGDVVTSTPRSQGATAVRPFMAADASTAVAAPEATAVLNDGPPTTARFRWWAAAAVALFAVAALAVGLGTRADGPPATGHHPPAITTTSALATTSTTATPTTVAPTTSSVASTTALGASPGKGNGKDKPKPKGKS